MKERIRSERVSEITGLSLRQIQAMASRGDIPGCAKLGAVWTFDEMILRRWIKQQEARKCQPISIGAAQSGGLAPKSPDVTIDEAYAQAIGLKPRSASPSGLSK